MNARLYQNENSCADIHVFLSVHLPPTELACSHVFHFRLLGAHSRPITVTLLCRNKAFWLLFPSPTFQGQGTGGQG